MIVGGYNRGVFEVEGFGENLNETLKVEFMNENLIAKRYSPSTNPENPSIEAIVPDLITLLDSESCESIQTEDLRYGLRVKVVTVPADPLMKTAKALSVVGPAAFGYDIP